MNTIIEILGNSSQLVEHIINVNDYCKRECGDYTYQPTPCAETMNFYHLLIVNNDEGLYLVK